MAISQGALQKLTQNLPIRLLRLLRYNKSRSDRAIELLAESKKPLFHGIPFLLHINHPAFPGYVVDEAVPFGLNNYSLREEVPDALRRLFPQNTALLKDMAKIWPEKRLIESLFLMGSIGSIGQSRDSDFDYWVCIDGKEFSASEKSLLQQKLSLIEQWADSHHELEVHFFLSDIEDVKNNHFGEADSESSGSAQALLLKAEFYTTHILIAGKAPFWWLMPEKVSNKQYQALIEVLKKGTNPDPKWFMDLGNLEALDASELFGAAIWQIAKAMDSPFKSVLKMAKLEVFLHNIVQQQPLCNQLKKRVHHGDFAPGQIESVDPYALMFDELIEHYTQASELDIVELLQICLYIKCAPDLSHNLTSPSFKQQVMAAYVKDWGWDKHQLRSLDNIHFWDYHKLMQLSRRIHGFLLACYRRLSGQLQQHQQSVDPVDMTVIGRKLAIFYGKGQGKVEKLRTAFEAEIYCPIITLQEVEQHQGADYWLLLEGDQMGAEDANSRALKRSRDPLQLLIWAIWNKLVDGHTRIILDNHNHPLELEAVEKLRFYLLRQFAPINVSDISKSALLAPSQCQKALVLLNFESAQHQIELEQIKLVYLNSWGELFFATGIDILDDIGLDLQLFSNNRWVLAPEGPSRKKLYQAFKKKTDIRFDYLH